jgi:hypothetical protein
MVASLGVAIIFQVLAKQYAGAAEVPWFIQHQLPLGVAMTTLAWVIATFVSKPTDAATLRKFYDKVRPAGPGWAKVRAESGLPASPDSLPMALLGTILGVTVIWTGLFATGSFIYGNNSQGAILGAVFFAASIGLIALVRKLWAKEA